MRDFQGEAEPAKGVADDVAGQDAAKMHSGRTSDLYETVSDAGKKSADANSRTRAATPPHQPSDRICGGLRLQQNPDALGRSTAL
jgi:hypothetical protein